MQILKFAKDESMGVLYIPDIPQYGVLVEKPEEIQNSMFCDIYAGAIDNVYDIMQGQGSTKNELFFNPCIAFVGNRGTGKSSAMSSFAHFLENSIEKNCKWIKNESVKRRISRAEFVALNAIDTANMCKTETIIADVASEMYRRYKEIDKDLSVEKKRDFIEKLKTAGDAAILRNADEQIKKGDQLLADTDKIVHIKDLFENAVKSFLSLYKGNTALEDRYLIIQLDDLDMNTTNAFIIMEEIRNILCIKNVIVLISVDIEQLKTVLKINFVQSLQTQSFDCGTEGKKTNKIAKDLSYKYIEKVLPLARRHYMLDFTIDQLNKFQSKNFLGDDDKNWEKLNLSSGEKAPVIMDAVLHLIWRKTMMIPMRNSHKDYALIPRNLRSLCNFIVFLRNMKDATFDEDALNKDIVSPLTYFDFADDTEGEKRRTILEHNLKEFNKYLISNLESCKEPDMSFEDEYLAETLKNLIPSLFDVAVKEMNSKIASEIILALENKQYIDDGNPSYYYQIINRDNCLDKIKEASIYPENVSMGDVMFILGRIEKITRCLYIRYLIEVIRTMWSIKMTNELYVNGCNPANDNNVEPSSKYITEDFRTAVGAMFVNPDATQFVFFDDIEKKADWSLYKDKNWQSICDIILPDRNRYIKYENDTTFTVMQWRINVETGEPCYLHYNAHEKPYYLSHPLLIFTNLLSPNLTRADNEPQVKKVVEWQNSNIMCFPFYSFDYMSRLYKESRRIVRQTKFSIKQSIQANLVEQFKLASIELQEEIAKYISCKNNHDRNKTDDGALEYWDLVFNSPLKKLDEYVSYKYLLLPVKKDVINAIDIFIKKVESCAADEDLTEDWGKLYEKLIGMIFNKLITDEMGIQKNPNTADTNAKKAGIDVEQIEKIKNLKIQLSGVSKNKQAQLLVPYYI